MNDIKKDELKAIIKEQEPLRGFRLPMKGLNSLEYIATFRHQARDAGWSEGAINRVMELSMAGDYDNLYSVYDYIKKESKNNGGK